MQEITPSLLCVKVQILADDNVCIIFFKSGGLWHSNLKKAALAAFDDCFVFMMVVGMDE
ncbi:MAG: hypothetical protein AB7P01_13740 [Bacteroidia bacterium]